MKALILDAARAGDAATTSAADALETRLAAIGYDIERFLVRDLDVRACIGCFDCWTRTPGQCVIDDDARRVSEGIATADVCAVVTPVSSGCYGSLAKGLLDRQICLVLPHFTMVGSEIHHLPRYDHYPVWLALGTLPSPDAEQAALFSRLVERNSVNMHNPAHGAQVVVGNESPSAAIESLLAEAQLGTEVLA
jgi:hypothetical protein